MRRTPAMRKRFAEWQRKFLQDDAAPPMGIISGFVESPIAADAAPKMSDKHWLSAMSRYDNDDFRNRRDFLIGGADQLASVLEARSKLEVWCATEVPDPEADPEPDAASPGREPLTQRGLNSVRGGIAYELSRFIWHKRDLVDPLADTIRRLVTDRTMAVRSMAAEIPLALLRYDAAKALDLLDLLLAGSADALLGIKAVTEVMRYRLGPDFARLLPHIERMIASEMESVQTNGSRSCVDRGAGPRRCA